MIYTIIDANGMGTSSGVHIRLMVSRGLKSTPYQNPKVTLGKPTIVILPEWKEAAPGGPSLVEVLYENVWPCACQFTTSCKLIYCGLCDLGCIRFGLMVSRGLKFTPYQNPKVTLGKPTIVILPEWKEAAPGEWQCVLFCIKMASPCDCHFGKLFMLFCGGAGCDNLTYAGPLCKYVFTTRSSFIHLQTARRMAPGCSRYRCIGACAARAGWLCNSQHRAYLAGMLCRAVEMYTPLCTHTQLPCVFLSVAVVNQS
jgi:hypothetical protein